MPRGSRPGERRGGRAKGVPNKRTTELEAKMKEQAEKIAQALPNAFEGDAHAFLMTVYKDPELPIDVRLDAAKAAAPFEKPKLASVDNKLSGNVGYTPVPVAERDAFDPVDASARPPGAGDQKASRH